MRFGGIHGRAEQRHYATWGCFGRITNRLAGINEEHTATAGLRVAVLSHPRKIRQSPKCLGSRAEAGGPQAWPIWPYWPVRQAQRPETTKALRLKPAQEARLVMTWKAFWGLQRQQCAWEAAAGCPVTAYCMRADPWLNTAQAPRDGPPTGVHILESTWEEQFLCLPRGVYT